MDMSQLTSLFGWMLVINVGVYALAAVFIIFARDFAANLEARITGVPAEKWVSGAPVTRAWRSSKVATL